MNLFATFEQLYKHFTRHHMYEKHEIRFGLELSNGSTAPSSVWIRENNKPTVVAVETSLQVFIYQRGFVLRTHKEKC